MEPLYKIADQYLTAFYALADSDFDEETIDNTLEAIEGELVIKGQNIVAFYLNLDAEITAMKAAEERIESRRKVLESKQARMKEYLKVNMKRCGVTEIKANDMSFIAKLYLDRDKAVEISDEQVIPKEYVKEKITHTVDKAAIRKAIGNGIVVPGACISSRDRLEIK